jgi:hypothetical protein
MNRAKNLSGMWQLCYWYPSNDHEGDDPSTYFGRLRQTGNELLFESNPNQEESYMLARLHLEDDLATGTWHETTSPHGAFKGMTYSGAGQLIVGPHHDVMEGMWAGAGVDHAAGKPRVYTGRWELKRVSE